MNPKYIDDIKMFFTNCFKKISLYLYMFKLLFVVFLAREEEEDDLMIDWFKLVSDKNELVRQEADIIYL